MPDWVWWVIGTIAVPVIVGPAVKKWYFDVQNRLRVEVRLCTTKTSEQTKRFLDSQKIPYDDPIRDLMRPIRGLMRTTSYATITIKNIGRRKISAVTVTLLDHAYYDTFCQIDDSDELLEVKEGLPVPIGDIQPRHHRLVHIWLLGDMTLYDFSRVRKWLRISADELDSVRFRYPMPHYLRTKYQIRTLITLSIILGAFMVGMYSWLLFFALKK
jgi:hypothetical protein